MLSKRNRNLLDRSVSNIGDTNDPEEYRKIISRIV